MTKIKSSQVLLFVVLTFVIWLGAAYWKALQPNISTQLSMQQVNGDGQDYTNYRMYQYTVDPGIMVAKGGATLLIFLLIFRRQVNEWMSSSSKGTAVALLLCSTLFTGCIKEYNVPEFETIEPFETAFVIPLELGNSSQAKFNSVAYLKEHHVAAKRFQYDKQWVSNGRLPNAGYWMKMQRVIKVDRRPVTFEWESHVGSDGHIHKDDNAVWMESADSIGFSMGFSVTGYVTEDNAAEFLYWYPNGSLKTVIAEEGKARVQRSASLIATKYVLDELRSKKSILQAAVEKDVVDYFSSRGITITTVGLSSGMMYENMEIQKAIDNTFVSQQLKVVTLAKLEAQTNENSRIKIEAAAIADAARSKSQGEADGINYVNEALQKAANNPQLIELRKLEVEKERIKQWDGHVPQYYIGGGSGAGGQQGVYLQMPPPVHGDK